MPIPAILARQRDNRLRQRPFGVAMRGAVALRAAPLTEQSTRLPLRQPMALFARSSPLGDVGWGSGVSLGHLPQDLFLQRQLRHDVF